METSRITLRNIKILALLSVVLLVVLVRPFLPAMVLAAVFAAGLAPAHAWLTRRLKGRAKPAAGLLLLALVVVAGVPVGIVGQKALAGARGGVTYLKATFAETSTDSALVKLGVPQAGVDWVMKTLQSEEGSALRARAQEVAAEVGQLMRGLVASVGHALVLAILVLITLFIFLVDGGRLVGWLGNFVPLQPRIFLEIMERFRSISAALLVAIVGTALVQSALAFVGYLIAHVPQPGFFAVLTFMVALVPMIGGAPTGILLALALGVQGHTGRALFLVLWSILVVGMADNFVRPLFLKGGLQIPSAPLFLSLLGGVLVFGPIGLLIGPLIMTFFVTMMEIMKREVGPHAGA